MSPRPVPSIAEIAPPPEPPGILPPDVASAEKKAQRDADEAYLRTSTAEPYVPGGPFSFFGDLLRVSSASARVGAALESPILRGHDAGPIPSPGERDDPLAAVQGRLSRFRIATALEQRDLTTTDAALKPSAPGWIAEQFGRASGLRGTLAGVFEPQRLEPGMVDTNGSGAPILMAIPQLSSGAAVAVQASQNAAIQETDPVTAAVQESPVATLAGQVDYSRQLLDFSQPRIDGVIADDLGRDFGAKLDAQIVNGSASGGNARGFLNWTGILSVTGSVATVQGFVADIWQAFQSLSGSSGVGNPDPDAYVTILHPRRLAWVNSGGGDTGVPTGPPNLPGRVVASSGIPTNLGAGTDEDVALVVERASVDLLAQPVTFRVDEESGSEELTVKTYAWSYLGVLVRNPAGIAKVTGLTPPAYA